jgi:serine protease Do
MNQQNDRVRDWYPDGTLRKSDAAAWYAAAGPANEFTMIPDREEQLRMKRKLRRTRILAGILCAALVLSAAGTVLARAMRFRAAAEAPEVQRPASMEDADAAAEVFEDFRDYFENYYTNADAQIPRAAAAGDVSLTLHPAPAQELSLQEIYARVSPAVVGISTTVKGEDYGWGTGVVFTPDGYIITNTHIISGCDGVTVSFPDGTEYEGFLVGEDAVSDIAVLKIEGKGFPYAEFGDSDELSVGDAVAAIGNPLGEEYAGTMTNGIVSAISRSLSNNGHPMTLLQTNAALNEGNSGGPLVNAYGQVIGITNMKIMSVYYNSVEGIGFAIPSAMIRTVADQLLRQGVVSGYPSLGIMAGPVSDEAMQLYGLPRGVYVSVVYDVSASGLQVGDVIVEVNGTPVASVADVNAIEDGFAVGDVLTLTIFRDGGTITIESVLIDSGRIG